eukprot:TRINITY_DN8323_c1_g2_i2.p1 TRINITY_DN8323_c1_g2~~TRINITY_DN8323_c1_g2_i2.p1  ORF type:complete len:210 (+),score=30.23 TRINITY_DN8323_c1_g2_i2:62-691(+)
MSRIGPALKPWAEYTVAELDAQKELKTSDGQSLAYVGVPQSCKGDAAWCPSCDEPIARFGRLHPCKHMLCFVCSRGAVTALRCPVCSQPVREAVPFHIDHHTVKICNFESQGRKCLRGYLSAADLAEHAQLRHGPGGGAAKKAPGRPPAQKRQRRASPDRVRSESAQDLARRYRKAVQIGEHALAGSFLAALRQMGVQPNDEMLTSFSC